MAFKTSFSLRRLSGRTSISNDLVMSASMGYAGKEVSKTHASHLEALKKLNLYQDERITQALESINKADFCTMKPNAKDYNPYSLDPQNIGLN
jgi:hypothetical protein